MAKTHGDHPNPKKRSNRVKTIICIGVLLICLGSFIATVAAPGDAYPDPFSVGPIFYKCNIPVLPVSNPIETPLTFGTK
jgi:hypothetical protein